MDRQTILTRVRTYLGTASDDPAYTDAILNPIAQEAADSILTDINQQNEGYNSTTVTLKSDTTTSYTYTFSTQATPITDFARWIEVRWTDSTGLQLIEVRYDELRPSGQDAFYISGIDSAPVLETSPDSTAGTDVWLRYTKWFADMSADTDVPAGIPLKFHDVIALEMLYAFGLGGEQRLPRELYDRWLDRRGQLIHHVGQRGSQPTRTRITTDPFD